MNGFNRSYMYRSTGTEKKGRKLRNHREDACKCFPTFVKFHCHDCPAVMKPCPVHGNSFRQEEKQQKVVRERNVIISFHPSTKTERLLQPIKTLLAHCNSETKINFQYYSSENDNSKESLKPRNGQNAYESLKKSLNNNIFVEKTKSFVVNKTNKVKRLKQCFHSPCNSIIQKTRSQTSIKEKLNQILREEGKQTPDFFYMVPEIPPDDNKFDPTSKWFSLNKGSFKNHDFLPDEKSDSDFITVTQQDKNNTVHHKIFEIKHRKGLNDIPFAGFPKQSQLFYSTVNLTGRTLKEKRQYNNDSYDRKELNVEKPVREEAEGTGEKLDPREYGKTNRSTDSSSSSSVYITPFIFVPKEMEDSDSEIKSKVKEIDVVEVGVQVEDQQTLSPTAPPKERQTSLISEQSSNPSGNFYYGEETKRNSAAETKRNSAEETKRNSVLLQTDSFLYEERICHSSRHLYALDCEPHLTTRVEQIYVGSHERAEMTKNFDDESFRQSKGSDVSRRTLDSTGQGNATLRNSTPDTGRRTRTVQMETCSGSLCTRTPDSGRYTRTVEMQPGNFTPRTEVLIQARRDNETRDRTSQTEDLWNMKVSVKTFDSGMNSEFIQLNSPDLTYVIKPFEKKESDRAIDKLVKTWWRKSHSDSDLYEKLKCACSKFDPENPYLQPNFSKNYGMNSTPEKSTITKVYESGPVSRGMENCRTVGNVTVRTKETVERFSDAKQTCTREEELSAAVSDLSELKKIIQEFFENGNLSSKRTYECCRTGTKEAKVDAEIMTDSSSRTSKQEDKHSFADITVQTDPKLFPKKNKSVKSLKTLNDEQKKKDVAAQTLKITENKEAETQATFFEVPKKGEKKEAETQVEFSEGPKKAEKKEAETQATFFEVPKKAEKKEAETQATFFEVPKKAEKNDTEAQTNVKVLLEEAEQERAESQKIKLRQTVVIDEESQSKTFFICAVCGREVKPSKNSATNTLPFPERPNLVTVGTEYTESYEIKLTTKTVQSADNLKAVRANPPIPSGNNEDRNDKAARRPIRQQSSSTPESSHKTRIPVPNYSASVHFKNSQAAGHRATDFTSPNLSQQRSTASSGSNRGYIECECICEEVVGPSTSRRQTLASLPTESKTPRAKPTKPPTKSASPRKEYTSVQNNRRSNPTGGQKPKTNIKEYYPVLATHFWPKEILKTWKSMEGSMSDIPSSDDSKSQTTKQKRRYRKELGATAAAAAGKKMKVAKHLSQEPLPEISALLRQIWSSNVGLYPAKTQEDEKNSTGTDEETVQNLGRSLRKNPLEIDEDFLQESLHSSDSSNTENSFFADEEDEEERTDEPDEKHNFKLMRQSHSAITFSKPFLIDDATSKSLNALLFFIKPKKHKTSRRKHSK